MQITGHHLEQGKALLPPKAKARPCHHLSSVKILPSLACMDRSTSVRISDPSVLQAPIRARPCVCKCTAMDV